MSSEDRPKPKPSLKEIAARAKDASPRSSLPPGSLSADLLAGRNSLAPSSIPPAAPSRPPVSQSPVDRLSAPPVSVPPSTSASVPPAPDSGKIDLRAMTAAPKTEPAPSVKTEPEAPAKSEAIPAAAVAAAPTKPAAAPQEEKKGSALPIAGGILLLAGIVGGFMMLNGSSSGTSQQALAPTNAPKQEAPAVTATAAEVVAKAEPEPVASAEEVKAEPEPAASSDAIDINSLGTTAAASASAAHKAGTAKAAGEKTEHAATAEVATAPTQTATAAPQPVAVAGGPVGDLKDEMRKRVGAEEGGNAPGSSGGSSGPAAKQDKPSMGQVQGALGAPRIEAKNCIEGSESVTRVNITFGSDGSVKSVGVGGGAAGKPAESCIRSAFMKAKVPAFTADSYSTQVTLRP